MSSKSAAPAASPFDLSHVRSRIVGHIDLLPSEIQDHPGQAWDHPRAQAEALAGILREVGIVDEILVYKSERANGAYVTPDGHLRKSLDPNKPWPCTVLDLSDTEADYVLATKDPVAMMKITNAAALDALLSSVQSSEAAVQQLLSDVATKAGLYIEKVEDALNEWQDMPEFEQERQAYYHTIIVHFDDDAAIADFAARLEQDVSKETRFIWHPKKERQDLKSEIWHQTDDDDALAEDTDDES